MNLLVILDTERGSGPAWPWMPLQSRVSLRHLRSADLAARIGEAAFIAVAVFCGLQAERWAGVEQLLVQRDVPMLAFEPVAAMQLEALRCAGTCIATLDSHGSVALNCRAQHSALQRIALARDNAGPPRGGRRTSRFVFRGN